MTKNPEGDLGAAHATERFTRELKRLLAFGVLRPAQWPELIASITAKQKEEPT